MVTQGDNHGKTTMVSELRFIHKWVVTGHPIVDGTLMGVRVHFVPFDPVFCRNWYRPKMNGGSPLCTEPICRIPKGFVSNIEGSNVGNVGRKCGRVAQIRLVTPQFFYNNNNFFYKFFLGALTPKLSWLGCKCCKLREGPILSCHRNQAKDGPEGWTCCLVH